MQRAELASLETEEIDGVKYVTATRVAEHVGVSRQTLWRWRQDGKVPAGNRYRDGKILFTLEEARQIHRFANRVEPIDGPSQPKLLRPGKAV